MKRVAYWVVTVLLAAQFIASGAAMLFAADENQIWFTGLGYPLYLGKILGPFKIAGAIVLLAPRLPRLKEWAYAGIVFNVVGAAASHILHSGDIVSALFPLGVSVLAAASWMLRPADRMLGTITSASPG